MRRVKRGDDLAALVRRLEQLSRRLEELESDLAELRRLNSDGHEFKEGELPPAIRWRAGGSEQTAGPQTGTALSRIESLGESENRIDVRQQAGTGT